MKGYAHNASRIAATLLALAAACGSGRPSQGFKAGVRYQDPAELDSENGLVAVTLTDACLSLNAATAPSATDPTATTYTDPLTGITYTTTMSTDPLTGITYTYTSWTDPTTGISYTATRWTDPLTGMPMSTTTQSATPTLLAASTAPIDPNACGNNMNGMSPNLLGVNGLNPNSLNDDHFKKWFAANPQEANLLMKYLVKCSLPLGLGLDFDYGGVTYLWPGLLGLAPHWANGESIPENEQQLVSACLGAHSNRYGARVPISLLGLDSNDVPLVVSTQELSDYPVTEGCFFGNLFKGDGVFSGNDRPQLLADDQSSLRACAMPDRTGSGASSMCAPIQYSGNCRDICQPDPTNLYYLNCTVHGKTYRAFSTRVMQNVEYTCGDGICQVTESCGTGSSWNNCGLDCGPCN